MTPTQLKSIKREFEEKFVRTTILGRDEGTVMFRDLLSGEVWQWIESKLEKVEEEIYKKWKYHSHSGLNGNFAVFMGWETAPDITVVYENGYKFIRSDKIEDYLESNKLGGKDD